MDQAGRWRVAITSEEAENSQQKIPTLLLSTHPEFVSGFERSTTAPANHRTTISASQRIGDLGGALRAVEFGLRSRLAVLRLRH
jgi:hypothetical protein